MDGTKKIPIAGPSITQREIDYVTDAVENAWYEGAGKYVRLFEEKACEVLGVQFAVALPSCTSGIHLALAASGIGEGDEVIVPDATWIASAAPIQYVGAKPRFSDIDSKTWCVTEKTLEQCLTPKTNAIIAVDLYGGMPDYEKIQTFAKDNQLLLIEDAAEAIGSKYQNKMAGTFGDVGVFSFHGSKTMTTGEGGMLVTNNQEIFERILFLRDHGRTPGDVSFRNQEVAFKYKMSDLQAAVGLAQIERLDELVDKKRDIFGWYQKHLSSNQALQLNYEPEGVFNSYWMTTAIIDSELGIANTVLAEKLSQFQIDTRPFFPPLSSIPAYEGTKAALLGRENNAVAKSIASRGLNLPSSLRMTEEDVSRVCKTLLSILDESQCRGAA